MPDHEKTHNELSSPYSTPDRTQAFEAGDSTPEAVLSAGDIQSMSDYFIPRNKAGLVEWLARFYPQDLAKFKRQNRRKLYAIFYSVLSRVRAGRYTGK